MFDAFIWMFKNDDFKKHYFYLLKSILVLLVILIGCAIPAAVLSMMDAIYTFILFGIAMAASLIFVLFICGYYWTLAENITDRSIDIEANSIYNGKIRKLYKIELPELNLPKLIWRGIASIVASIIAYIPLILLLFLSAITGNLQQISPFIIMTICILYSFFVQALFWNYANKNSIVAVLNYRKAIFIIGNYTWRYIWNVFLLLFLNSIISTVPGIIQQIANASQNISLMILAIIADILIIPVAFYMIFVNTYLIGTLAPEGEI